MKFYRYAFFRIYSFFERINSSNSHNAALGILSISLVLLLYKVHFLLTKYLLDRKLYYDEIAILYLFVFVIVYTVNYFILMRQHRYIETENFFKEKQNTKAYDMLLLCTIFVGGAVFVLL
jgi:cobalamin synthase